MKQLTRGIIYLAGLAILARGITLNTKTGLGVSPIIAVAYAVSELWGTDFGNTVLLWYCVFVLVEIVLFQHLFLKKIQEVFPYAA